MGSAEFQAVKRYGHAKYEKKYRRDWGGGNARTAELVQRHRRAVRRWEREICVEAQLPPESEASFGLASWAVAEAAVGDGGILLDSYGNNSDEFVIAAGAWVMAYCAYTNRPTAPSREAERRAHAAMFAAGRTTYYVGGQRVHSYGSLHRRVKLFKRQLDEVARVQLPKQPIDGMTTHAVVMSAGYAGVALDGFGRQVFSALTGETYDKKSTPRHHPALVWIAENHPHLFKDGRGWGNNPPVRVCPVPGGIYRIELHDVYEQLIVPTDNDWTFIE